jgi:DNA-nicking Smr family endonuclease
MAKFKDGDYPVGDSDLFRAAMRGVKPLAAIKPPAVKPPKPLAKAAPPPKTKRSAAPGIEPAPGAGLVKAGPALEIGGMADLDRASFEKLKRGKMEIEARLDLHGQTQDEAHRELSAFIARAQSQGKRLALVVTGKGREGKGVLRESAPRWLNEPALRNRVLAITQAQPRDGGAGALYVLLRKIRP